MPYVARASDASVDYEKVQQLYESIAEVTEGQEPSLIAHACLSYAFAIFQLGEATNEQATIVCQSLADKFPKKAN